MRALRGLAAIFRPVVAFLSSSRCARAIWMICAQRPLGCMHTAGPLDPAAAYVTIPAEKSTMTFPLGSTM